MTPAAADPDRSAAAASLVELVDGVFAWVQPDGSWWINNAGAIAGVEGTTVVDTCATATRTRRFLGALADATGNAPIRTAVNTHQHGDHTYGNCLLPDATVIIGHHNMREGLLHDELIERCPPIWHPVPEWGDVTLRVPTVAVEHGLTIHSGDRRVDVHHPGYAAHTTGDLVAWLADERVLFAGDLVFHGLTPLVFMGSVEGALRSLAWLADFDAAHLVPGHGPLVDAAHVADVLGDHERYYRFVLDTARRGIADGVEPLAAAQAVDLGEFAEWADAERIVLNVHRAYADLGGPAMDIAQAMVDAVTYNGGPMTTHVCS